jgi:hypothetical protein
LDPVFGAKNSLSKRILWCDDLAMAKAHNTTPFRRTINGQEQTGFWLLEHDFVLADKQEIPVRKIHD